MEDGEVCVETGGDRVPPAEAVTTRSLTYSQMSDVSNGQPTGGW